MLTHVRVFAVWNLVDSNKMISPMLFISVHGIWGDWSGWKECSATCGGGTQDRNRNCSQPLHGGDDCAGDSIETQDCNTFYCPG